MTTHSWDEIPTGSWTLEIENVAGASDYGKASFLNVCDYHQSLLQFKCNCVLIKSDLLQRNFFQSHK